MLSRPAIGRQAQRVVSRQWQQPAARRGLASPASGSFQYESGNANGIKVASRDMAGPTTQLALVSQAGTRFEPLPGLTIGLEAFAFKVGHSRSRIVLRAEGTTIADSQLAIRAPTDARHFEFSANLNFSGPSFRHRTPEKTSS